MPEQEHHRLLGGRGISLHRAESLVSELGKDLILKGEFEVDLESCEHIHVGAGWRVGNALRRIDDNCRLTVRVPNPGDFSGAWFQNFTRSGLGFAIPRYADTVVSSNENITNRVREYYSVAKAVGSTVANLKAHLWTAENFCMIESLDRGVLNPNDIGEFSSMIFTLLEHVSFDSAAYRSDAINESIDLLFQSVQNVYDHSGRKPLSPNTRILSHISMRYYRDFRNTVSVTPDFSHYMNSLSALPLEEIDYVGFIEFVVNDDGVGMACRQSLDSDVYWRPLELEVNALETALTSGQSVKPLSQDALFRGDPGYGMTRIESALSTLKAFALLRTGRLEVSLNSFASAKFNLAKLSLGYMPGTTLQIILPCLRHSLWSKA